MSGADIKFRLDSSDDERRFLREYLVDAWERYRASDYWETGWFWAYHQLNGYDVSPDGGLVVVVFEGDPDRFVTAEADHWDSFDTLDSWKLRRYEETDGGFDSLRAQQQATKGEVDGEREYRLKPLAARLSLAYLQEFEDPLPAVGEPGGETRVGAGYWVLFHYLCIQSGYDWYEETNMYLRGLRNRLKSIALYRGTETAREEYERIHESVAAMEEHLNEWFDTHPTGEGSVP